MQEELFTLHTHTHTQPLPLNNFMPVVLTHFPLYLLLLSTLSTSVETTSVSLAGGRYTSSTSSDALLQYTTISSKARSRLCAYFVIVSIANNLYRKHREHSWGPGCGCSCKGSVLATCYTYCSFLRIPALSSNSISPPRAPMTVYTSGDTW